MRQIGLAVLQFCDTHKGQFPDWDHTGTGDKSWIYTVAGHLENVDEIRLCPDDFLLFERRYMKSTSYVINDYLVEQNVPGAIRNLNKLQATSKTIVMFEGADRRQQDPKKGDPHQYDAATDSYIYADPKYDHAHASQWFSQLNKDNWSWSTGGEERHSARSAFRYGQLPVRGWARGSHSGRDDRRMDRGRH